MRRIAGWAILLGLLATGCRWPWEPRFGTVIGTVRYPNGTTAAMAKVQVAGIDATFTDALGRYRLKIIAGGDSVTVSARDGYDGRAYVENRTGSVRVAPGAHVIVANIVLDHAEPI